jgi:hypothetical protein
MLGPPNKAFDVSDEIIKFVCSNGAGCKSRPSYVSDDVAIVEMPATQIDWVKTIGTGLMILVVLIGAILVFRQSKIISSEEQEEEN